MSQQARSWTASLVVAVQDHARGLEPLIGPLFAGIVGELQPAGWTSKRHKKWAFSLTSPSGRTTLHVRPFDAGNGRNTALVAYDRWNHGYDPANRVAVMETRTGVARFIETCLRTP